MARIALSKGHFATVDDADLPLLAAHTWWVTVRTHTSYAYTTVARKTVMMHRLILAAPKGTEVDHKNRDGLDNRRENLRLATRSDQNVNLAHRKISKAGYRGISDWATLWSRAPQEGRVRFQARLSKEGKTYRQPPRHTAEEAALDYDALAREHHGEFAILNFPDPPATP